MSKNSRLVYSTDQGKVKKSEELNPTQSGVQSGVQSGDGIVRIQRETKGRGGKAVSVVLGIPADKLKEICQLLKSRCATGGAVKENNIEIQGDHRDKIKELLEKQGFQVKLAGG
jgi:translation initiation factor 1